MNKTKKENKKLREMQEARGLFTRERRKKFLYLRNTNQYDEYYRQIRGIKSAEINTSKGSGIPKLSLWERIINFKKNLLCKDNTAISVEKRLV